ncbi:MAG: AMP-binding protein [Candidatus Zixiibacteriota bacterium]|nr:MAG: AMP-binding protein [candidate division Zixibacteria bacterium]
MRLIDPGQLTTCNTIHETILASCRKHSEKTAMTGSGKGGARYSYADLERLIVHIAGALRNAGLGDGQRVGLLAENCPEWGVFYLAVLMAGGIIVPFDCSLKPLELAKFLRISRIRFLACSEKRLDTARDVIELNGLPIETLKLECPIREDFRFQAEGGIFDVPRVGADDTAVLIYTSGTTGDPKGVVLTHGNIVSNLEGIVHSLDFYSDDIFFSVLPLHHTFEATCGLLMPLFLGLTIAYSRSLKSRDIFDGIRENRATCMVAVPLLYEKIHSAISRRMTEQPFFKKLTLGSLYAASKIGWRVRVKVGRTFFKGLREKAGLDTMRLFVSGGAPLPARVAEWFNLMGFTLLEGYGLTECSPVVSVNKPDDIRFGSVGPPLENVELAIDSPAPDGIGEIILKAPSASPGYLDNPEASAELLRSGWLYTGDLGKIEDGHLVITGRKKNLIVTGAGKNIYPEEIESELNLSPFISESLILGRQRQNKTGEEVCAIIVPNLEQFDAPANPPDHKPSPQQIREKIETQVADVNRRLADFKRISRFEIQFDELEKTSTKKIRRNLYK